MEHVATEGAPIRHPIRRRGSSSHGREDDHLDDTRLSLLAQVRDPGDGPSWSEFHAIYRPLIFGYLRSLGLKEHDANDLTQEVFCRLMAILPTFELDRRRGRFRTYLWRLTYTTLVDGARKKKVRDRAEEEWVRHFSEADESASKGLEELWTLQHRKRILEVTLPRVRASVSRDGLEMLRRAAGGPPAGRGDRRRTGDHGERRVRLCLAGPERGPAPLCRDRGGAGRWLRS